MFELGISKLVNGHTLNVFLSCQNICIILCHFIFVKNNSCHFIHVISGHKIFMSFYISQNIVNCQEKICMEKIYIVKKSVNLQGL